MAEPDAPQDATAAVGLPQQLGDAILELVVVVPPSAEPVAAQARARAQAIAHATARKSSALAATLSLPPGVLGWVTVLPELLGVWKLQAQMVADIAAAYGQTQRLGPRQMLYCLFKQVAAQLLRDVAVRVGERAAVQQASYVLLRQIAQQLGVVVSKALLQRAASRLVPLLGAATVGAYVYYDTLQVARTATELFESAITLDAPDATGATSPPR
ncbi:MAG: hypothetical protein ACT4NV_15885 [Rhodoferax sp.]